MKKKKVYKIVVIVLVIVLIVGGIVAYAKLPHSLNIKINNIEPIGTDVEIVKKDDESYTLKNTKNRDFKIQTFTDMHLDGNNKTSRITIANFLEAIAKEKPDFVVLGGDIITSAMNQKRTRQLGEIMEKLGIYWAYTIGNHEGDNNFSISRDKLVEILSGYDHCLMMAGPKSIWGASNYYINILNADDTLNQTLFFMDTGDEASDETKAEYGITTDKGVDDGVKKDQVDWYKNSIKKLKKEYGSFTSTVFIHIPLPQFDEIEEKDFLYGGKLENCCCSEFDSGLFDAIVEMKSTKAVFSGHDHVNDFGFEKDGILLGYMQSSGYGSYTTLSRFGYEEKDWLQGYMILTLEKDGSFTRENYKYSQIGISNTK